MFMAVVTYIPKKFAKIKKHDIGNINLQRIVQSQQYAN